MGKRAKLGNKTKTISYGKLTCARLAAIAGFAARLIKSVTRGIACRVSPTERLRRRNAGALRDWHAVQLQPEQQDPEPPLEPQTEVLEERAVHEQQRKRIIRAAENKTQTLRDDYNVKRQALQNQLKQLDQENLSVEDYNECARRIYARLIGLERQYDRAVERIRSQADHDLQSLEDQMQDSAGQSADSFNPAKKAPSPATP
jgi:uncharacterized protein YhaN